MKDIRGALYDLLPSSLFSELNPPLLQTDIYFNDSIDTAPKDRLFVIIRMESWDSYDSSFRLKRRLFSVWVHAPRRIWLDHSVCTGPLGIIMDTLMAATDVVGQDGILTSCCFKGLSADLTDEGYQTITNNVSLEAGVR